MQLAGLGFQGDTLDIVLLLQVRQRSLAGAELLIECGLLGLGHLQRLLEALLALFLQAQRQP
ncbi:hypothetical protein D3C75_1287020 [compost metagenome]